MAKANGQATVTSKRKFRKGPRTKTRLAVNATPANRLERRQQAKLRRKVSGLTGEVAATDRGE